MDTKRVPRIIDGFIGFVAGAIGGAFLGLVVGGTFLGDLDIYEFTGLEGYELSKSSKPLCRGAYNKRIDSNKDCYKRKRVINRVLYQHDLG